MVVPFVPQIQNPTEKILNDINNRFKRNVVNLINKKLYATELLLETNYSVIEYSVSLKKEEEEQKKKERGKNK